MLDMLDQNLEWPSFDQQCVWTENLLFFFWKRNFWSLGRRKWRRASWFHLRPREKRGKRDTGIHILLVWDVYMILVYTVPQIDGKQCGIWKMFPVFLGVLSIEAICIWRTLASLQDQQPKVHKKSFLDLSGTRLGMAKTRRCTFWKKSEHPMLRFDLISYIYIYIDLSCSISTEVSWCLTSTNLPTYFLFRCHSFSFSTNRGNDAPWGALMQSIKGTPLFLGIGAMLPEKVWKGKRHWAKRKSVLRAEEQVTNKYQEQKGWKKKKKKNEFF